MNNIEENDFIKKIQYGNYEEKARIIELQNKYKAGIIKEEDMTGKEIDSLIELYKKQNERLEQIIEEKRIRIRKKLNELKG